MKKTWLVGLYREYTTQVYIGIIINHYKDHYYPTSIVESNKGFFVAHLKNLMFKEHAQTWTFQRVPNGF